METKSKHSLTQSLKTCIYIYIYIIAAYKPAEKKFYKRTGRFMRQD